jgi:hypothetical protein
MDEFFSDFFSDYLRAWQHDANPRFSAENGRLLWMEHPWSVVEIRKQIQPVFMRSLNQNLCFDATWRLIQMGFIFIGSNPAVFKRRASREKPYLGL